MSSSISVQLLADVTVQCPANHLPKNSTVLNFKRNRSIHALVGNAIPVQKIQDLGCCMEHCMLGYPDTLFFCAPVFSFALFFKYRKLIKCLRMGFLEFSNTPGCSTCAANNLYFTACKRMSKETFISSAGSQNFYEHIYCFKLNKLGLRMIISYCVLALSNC